MTNNHLQLNNDKTKMILTASKTILNSDSVPRSISLEGSNIKFANTVHNLGLDPSLSIWNFVGLVQYATVCPKMSPKVCCVRLLFQD